MSKLNPNKSEVLKTWVRTHHGGDLTCPVCHQHDDALWTGEEVMSLSGKETHPHYLLICETCGYTFTFDYRVAKSVGSA